MISTAYPPDVREFVEMLLEGGVYSNEQHVFNDDIRVLRELRKRESSLKSDIQEAILELESGVGEPWDPKELKDTLIRSRSAERDGSIPWTSDLKCSLEIHPLEN